LAALEVFDATAGLAALAVVTLARTGVAFLVCMRLPFEEMKEGKKKRGGKRNQ
jgi:hypothetical protein